MVPSPVFEYDHVSSSFSKIMICIVFLPNSYVEVLTPKTSAFIVFGDRVFKELIRVQGDHEGLALIQYVDFVIQKRRLEYLHPQREEYMKTQEDGRLQTKGRSLRRN